VPTVLGPFRAITGSRRALFDDLVGTQQERFRHRKTDRLRGFEIDGDMVCAAKEPPLMATLKM
jgi:hypothetical protein